ncbi:MAG: cysteine hydrolase [Pseudomonadales bacterium]|nr:cysteine hydrolase [Pseudomonadales bacterium]
MKLIMGGHCKASTRFSHPESAGLYRHFFYLSSLSLHYSLYRGYYSSDFALSSHKRTVMPIDISPFCLPDETAIIITECQNAVLGANSPLKGLVACVEQNGMLENIARLLEQARPKNIPVFHCTVERREDGFGDPLNTPLTLMMAKHGGASAGMATGSEGARIVDALKPAATDILMPRLYGMTSFHETGLDHFLRNSGIKNVIICGVSLNIAVIGATIEAVNRGYRVLVPADCVEADSAEYKAAILKNSLRSLAFVTDSQTIISHWC